MFHLEYFHHILCSPLLNFIFIPGLQYQELSFSGVNLFKVAIQKLVRKTPTGNSKILSVLQKSLKSRSSSEIIVLITNNNPDDSTPVSKIFPDIDITKIQVRSSCQSLIIFSSETEII